MDSSNDTFYSRIPTLSDAELLEYRHHYSLYKEEAIRLVLKELQARGHLVPEEELAAIENFFNAKASQSTQLLNFDTSRCRLIAGIVLIIGLFASVVVYLTASPVPVDPFGVGFTDTKANVR